MASFATGVSLGASFAAVIFCGAFWWATLPQMHGLSCHVEGVKSPVACNVTSYGRWLNVSSGEYLNFENVPSLVSKAGLACMEKFHAFVSPINAWLSNPANNPGKYPGQSWFVCYNRLSN